MALLATGQMMDVATENRGQASTAPREPESETAIRREFTTLCRVTWRLGEARNALAGYKQVQAALESSHTRKLADPGLEGCVEPEKSVRKRSSSSGRILGQLRAETMSTIGYANRR